jgi:DNA-binding response OmpR family regulator
MPNSEKKIVVVVSDDSMVQQEAQFGFPTGVEIVAARDSHEALMQMKAAVPSVVVVDIQTGNAGGFALAREMKALSRLARVPILMLLERDQDRWLAQQAGASEIATKPIDASDLARRALALVA